MRQAPAPGRLAALMLLLSGCSVGAGGSHTASPAPAARWAPVSASASAPAPGSRDLSGSIGQAGYRIDVPAAWNGTLMLNSHGYTPGHPERFAGALPLCGVLGGSVGAWNQALDAAFALKSLLGPAAISS